MQVDTVDALQVVEPVAVLQVLELGLEHVVERRAKQAAEHVRLLGHAADPEVDVLEAGRRGAHAVNDHVCPGAGAGQEAQPIGRHGEARRGEAGHDRFRGRALSGDRGLVRDGRMFPVRGDEIDERLVVPQRQPELEPVLVRRERRVLRHEVELPSHLVERRDAFTAAASQVDRGQVERQADEGVTHRGGDELVELVADLAREAAYDRPCGLVGRQHARRSAVVELQRVEEGVEEPYLVVRAVRVDAVQPLRQHRVAETVDRVRELGADRRVDAGQAAEERVDERLNLAGELLEHEMLILHLGHEARRLEQALVVIPARRRVHGLPRGDLGSREQRGDLAIDVVPQPVVLGVEDEVHGRQADVLVAAAVTRDVVRVQQLVVVGAVRLHARAEVTDRGVGVGHQSGRGHRVVRDVVEERMSGPECVVWNKHAQAAVGRRVAFNEHAAGPDHLREAVGPWLEVAVRVGDDERHVQHVGVDELDTKPRPGLGLHLAPVADVADLLAGAAAIARSAAQRAVEHKARLRRSATDGRVLAEEHLVRRVRRVGLVLVHPRRRFVHALLDVVGRADDPVRARLVEAARHDHEVGRAAGAEQRVVRLERHDHVAAALGHEVEAVVEELAEEGEHQVERRRQAEVGRDVRDEQRAGRHVPDREQRVGTRGAGVGVGADEPARAARMRRDGDRRGIGVRLVRDQVGNDARLRVDDRVVEQLLLVRGPLLGVLEDRRRLTREQPIGLAEGVLIWDGNEVVARPVHGPEAHRELRVAIRVTDAVDLERSRPEQRVARMLGAVCRGMRLPDHDLVEDEAQILAVKDEPGTDRRALRLGLHRDLRRQERNACRRKNHGQHGDDRPGPGPRAPQPEASPRSHMPSPHSLRHRGDRRRSARGLIRQRL